MAVNVTHHDDYFTLRTDDNDPYLAETRAAFAARVHAAVQTFRANGEPRPVQIQLLGNGPDGEQVRAKIRERLRSAVPITPMFPGTQEVYVLSRANARYALEPVAGNQARRLFRVPSWPVSMYGAYVVGDQVDVLESQSKPDIAASGMA